MLTKIKKPTSRSFLSNVILWLGLSACVYYVVSHPEILQPIAALGRAQLLVLCILLLSIWGCSIANWRCLVQAVSGADLRVGDAARQMAKLLIGKYVPGGVWGFLARHDDAAMPGSATKGLFAGLIEQSLGLFCVGVIGGAAYLAAMSRNPLLLLPAVITPWLYVLGLRAMLAAAGRLGWFISIPYDRSKLVKAASFAVLQQLFTICLLAYLASALLDLHGWAALLLGGAYLLAVVFGMLVLFAPGGIFVREAAFAALMHGAITTVDALALAAMLRILFLLADLLYVIMAFALNSTEKRP